MDKRILLIVEGPRDEGTLVRKLWDRFDRNARYDVITYLSLTDTGTLRLFFPIGADPHLVLT